MKLLIIQTSPKHTASTLLVNSIYGLIPELSDKKIIGIWDDNFENYFENIIVVKNHNTNIDELINKYNEKFKLIFICSERQEMNYLIDEKYKNYDNVVVFEFNELNETNDNTLIQIVDNIYAKLKDVLSDVELYKTKCIERIKLMNIRSNFHFRQKGIENKHFRLENLKASLEVFSFSHTRTSRQPRYTGAVW
jgi:hypothetical protein